MKILVRLCRICNCLDTGTHIPTFVCMCAGLSVLSAGRISAPIARPSPPTWRCTPPTRRRAAATVLPTWWTRSCWPLICGTGTGATSCSAARPARSPAKSSPHCISTSTRKNTRLSGTVSRSNSLFRVCKACTNQVTV
jgi:hypothetical protein